MKKLSLKARLVLLHTGVMILVVCVVLALLFSISSHEILSNVESALEERTADDYNDIDYEDGHTKFD